MVDAPSLRERFDVLCAARWDQMTPTQQPNVRTCRVCDRPVCHAQTEAELSAYTAQGHCVAVLPPTGESLIAVPRRFDVILEVMGTGRRVCNGPVVSIGAQMPPGSLSLEGTAERHAEIGVSNAGAVSVTPLQGAVQVNGAVVEQKTAVNPGDRLAFGDQVVLVVQVVATVPDGPVTMPVPGTMPVQRDPDFAPPLRPTPFVNSNALPPEKASMGVVAGLLGATIVLLGLGLVMGVLGLWLAGGG